MNPQWYVRGNEGEVETGPFERAELVESVLRGQTSRGVQVRREDQQTWATLGNHSAFRAGLDGWRPGARPIDNIPGLPGSHYLHYDAVPFYNKQWFFWLMYFTVTPVALGVLIFGDVYYRKNGDVKVFSMANKVIAGLIGVAWVVKLIAGRVR
ncbi:MAG: GYF domain-containing protein [Byssovorax sp.]